ncbi:MAG: mechanosensitive ion channel family protein [Desulfobacteraceae bacterium]|nr:mechanosensitive ion channel family protein [Desulfobacteraceae bacterium]
MNEIIMFMEKMLTHFSTDSELLKILYKATATILLFFIVWLIIKKILTTLEKRVTRYEWLKFSADIFIILRKALFLAMLLIFGTYLVRLLGITLLESPFHAVVIILIASPVSRFLHVVLKLLRENLAAKTETNVDDIIFDLLNRFSGVIVYAVAAVAALDVMGINIMPFIAGAGVLGVAIGFAAKDTLSNLIAGVLLIMDRPFEVGDRIEVWNAPAGSATWGDVMDIGIRATKIKTTDNIIIVIPNNEIMTRDIINYTSNTNAIRVRINIGVAYDTDLEKAKQTILEVAQCMDWIKTDPAPVVVVKSFGESSVDLQLRVWIENARKRIHTISYVTDNVKSAFDKAGIEIPFPKRDITIITKSPSDQENQEKENTAK